MKTIGSVIADRIGQGKKTKFKLELTKTVDCFLDGHGKCTSILVSIKIKSFKTNQFLNAKEICINHLVVQMI